MFQKEVSCFVLVFGVFIILVKYLSILFFYCWFVLIRELIDCFDLIGDYGLVI